MTAEPELCLHCTEPIAAGEARAPITDRMTGQVRHEHVECAQRSVIGSVAHIQHRCSCYVPGSDEGDPPDMTRRQAARAAVAAWATQLATAPGAHLQLDSILHQLRERAQADFQARRGAAHTLDNALLPAGSPMIYYCRYCGWASDILPESWFLAIPRQVCSECEAMLDRGWLDEAQARA